MKRSRSLTFFCLLGCLLIVFGKQIVQGRATAVTPLTSARSPLSAGFTYQGYLHSDGAPVNSACDFRFALWDTAVDGSQVGDFQEVANVPVSEGLFTVILNDTDQMGVDIFSGEARWLEIWVRCPAGGTGYTVLAPRQPLTTVPYAQGLMPEAVIRADVAAPALTISNSGGSALFIDEAGNHGISIGNALDAGMRVGHSDGDGLVICNTGTASGCPRSSSNSAIEIGNVEDIAIRVNATGSTGIVLNSTGSTGILVNDATHSGFAVNGTGLDGMFMGTIGEAGVNIFSTGEDGFRVCRVGNASCSNFDEDNHSGLEVGNAEDYGVKVLEAGRAGFRIDEPGTNGFYAYDAGDSGVWIRDAANYAGFFGGNINVTGSCSGCLLATFGINKGQNTLNPGDIVAVAGTQAGAADNTEMLLQVQAAAVGQPLVGVVSGRADLHTSTEDETTILVARDGEPAGPNDYVTIIIYGPVPVPAQASFGVGERVTLAADGRVRALQTVTLDGVPLAEAAPTLGLTLEAHDSDGDGLIWILVNPH